MRKDRIAPTLGLILLAVAGVYGCGGRKELTRVTADDSLPLLQEPERITEDDLPVHSAENGSSEITELTALADTREDAEEIAGLYGIELSAYSYGVATYTTDKNPQELIELGLKKGYPALTPEYEAELHEEPHK